MAVDVLFTNTDAIRAAIGADEADIEDTIITGQNMEAQMKIALAAAVPTYKTDQLTLGKKPALELWCMWFGALRLAESPLATAKKFGTGKDEFERFDVDWEELRRLARSKLSELQETLNPSAVAQLSIMGKATPASNPILGT